MKPALGACVVHRLVEREQPVAELERHSELRPFEVAHVRSRQDHRPRRGRGREHLRVYERDALSKLAWIDAGREQHLCGELGLPAQELPAQFPLGRRVELGEGARQVVADHCASQTRAARTG